MDEQAGGFRGPCAETGTGRKPREAGKSVGNEEHHHWRSIPDIIQAMKSRRMRWAERGMCGKEENFMWDLARKGHLEDIGIDRG